MKTASFSSYTGPGRISIARYAPRGTPAGFRIYKPLAPGPWFNSVSKSKYEKLYRAQLAELSAPAVFAELHELAAGAEPVLMCWEHPADIAAGRTFCHRHQVAEWFKKEIGAKVPELVLRTQ